MSAVARRSEILKKVEFEVTSEEERKLRAHLADIRSKKRPLPEEHQESVRLRPRSKTARARLRAQLTQDDLHSSDSEATRAEKKANRVIAQYDEENESNFSDGNSGKARKNKQSPTETVDEADIEVKTENVDGENVGMSTNGRVKKGEKGPKTKKARSRKAKGDWKRPDYYDTIGIPTTWTSDEQQEEARELRKKVVKASGLDLTQIMTTLLSVQVRYPSGRIGNKWDHSVDLVYSEMLQHGWTRDACGSVLKNLIMTKTQNTTHKNKNESTTPAKIGRRPWSMKKAGDEEDEEDEEIEVIEEVSFPKPKMKSTSDTPKTTISRKAPLGT